MAMAPTFDVGGWFAASPGTFRKAGLVLLESAAREEKIGSVLFARDAFHLCDEPVGQALRSFVKRALPVLPETGDAIIAPGGFEAWRTAFRNIQGREIWSIYGAWIRANRPALGPGIRERIEYASTVTEEMETAARNIMQVARAQIRDAIPRGTVLCVPTAPCIAPFVDASTAEQEAFRARAQALTCIAGLGGLPQVSIPATIVDGCPAGLSFIGWAGADEVLLELAVALAPYCGA
jgi:amidase